ncbi:ectonucleoside triphosphate diphosphohydrolase 2-like [Genypterus blacodes]|uniref:ectonucleoside triphosphate diphosphohydrolase 2-like n=1 Tax=Genypterus blacodes TaxID=154954 RepID=UPI003F776A4C
MSLLKSPRIPAAALLALSVVGIILLVPTTIEVMKPPENMYGIVIDAGSSHTSMYIYKWPADKQNGTGVVTQHSQCHVEGGGISSYAGSRGGAARSLEPCLEHAIKDIPKSRHHQTPLYLGATAGMRLLSMVNHTESEEILREVGKKLRSYPFNFSSAAILSGQEEGAYGWVTVNYLLENLIKYGFVGRWMNPDRESVGAMDLGGASTQITFETSEHVEDKGNNMQLNLYGRVYNLYTQSFLCYGMGQVLKKLLAHLIMTQGVGPQLMHPCYPAQFNVSITLGKDVFDSPCTNIYKASFDPQMSVTLVGTGEYQYCLGNISEMFSFDNCSFTKCSFNGVFQPNVTGSYMAFSAFYFTYNYLDQLTGIPLMSPDRMREATQLVCNMTIPEMYAKTKQQVKHLKNICASATFIQVLLTKGYGFNERSFPRVTFQRKVGGSSVGWALGLMLSMSNMLPGESLGVMKALPPGPWTGILFIFISILLLALVYLALMTFKKKKPAQGNVYE